MILSMLIVFYSYLLFISIHIVTVIVNGERKRLWIEFRGGTGSG